MRPASSGLIMEVGDWTIFRWDVIRNRCRRDVKRNHGHENGDLMIRVDHKGEPIVSIVGVSPLPVATKA